MDKADGRRGIQSVEIAFKVLTALQASVEPQALKQLAQAAGLSPSATNNYLVSLCRTGLAASDTRPGHYRLGPAALALGMSAIQQIDGFEIVRLAVNGLRDETRHSTAVTAWSDDGPVSLYKRDGDLRGAWEMRTGLVPLLATAAGRLFVAGLPLATTRAVLLREWPDAQGEAAREAFCADARRELAGNGFVTTLRDDLAGYASMAAPVHDRNGDLCFALSIVGTRATLDTSADGLHARALVAEAARATVSLGGPPGFRMD